MYVRASADKDSSKETLLSELCRFPDTCFSEETGLKELFLAALELQQFQTDTCVSEETGRKERFLAALELQQSQTRSASLKSELWSSFKPAQLKRQSAMELLSNLQ